MTSPSLYPLGFGLLGEQRWGDWLDQILPGEDAIGEASALGDRADHASVVAEGPLKGTTLTDLMREAHGQILGEQAGALCNQARDPHETKRFVEADRIGVARLRVPATLQAAGRRLAETALTPTAS